VVNRHQVVGITGTREKKAKDSWSKKKKKIIKGVWERDNVKGCDHNQEKKQEKRRDNWVYGRGEGRASRLVPAKRKKAPEEGEKKKQTNIGENPAENKKKTQNRRCKGEC